MNFHARRGTLRLARQAGLEPATGGFGGHYTSSCASAASYPAHGRARRILDPHCANVMQIIHANVATRTFFTVSLSPYDVKSMSDKTLQRKVQRWRKDPIKIVKTAGGGEVYRIREVKPDMEEHISLADRVYALIVYAKQIKLLE
jgi:hypothetical protein